MRVLVVAFDPQKNMNDKMVRFDVTQQQTSRYTYRLYKEAFETFVSSPRHMARRSVFGRIEK
jgi:hypothetical protein